MQTRFDEHPEADELDGDGAVDEQPEENSAPDDDASTPSSSDKEDGETQSDDTASDGEDDADSAQAKRPSWFHRRRRLLAAFAVVLLAAGAGGYYWYQSTVLPAGVAFRVSGHDVTIDELGHETDTLRALYGIQAPTDAAKLETFRRDVAKSYAVSIVLDNAAADHKVVVADKMAQDTLGRFVEQQFGSGNDARDKFIQALGTVGTTEQAVLVEIKRQLAVNQLFEQISSGVVIPDADVQKAFGQRKDQLGTPEQRDLHNIVVSSKAEADQVVQDIGAGAPFETVAQQRSLDASTKTAGGALGVVSAAQLDKAYADTAFTAPINTIFGPVQTKFGWNVGRVIQVMAPVPAVFDQVKDNLKQQLQLEQQLGKWRTWLADSIKGASVHYADTYRPADPDAPPQGQPGTPGVTDQTPPK